MRDLGVGIAIGGAISGVIVLVTYVWVIWRFRKELLALLRNQR